MTIAANDPAIHDMAGVGNQRVVRFGKRLTTNVLQFAHRVWNTNVDSNQLLVGIALAFGATTFLLSELMHYIFVPGLGRHSEHMLAEGISSLLSGLLAGMLFNSTIERRRIVAARLQVIGEMNHHIRNALDVISLSTYTIQDRQSVVIISEAVHRIEWALREILPRDAPSTKSEDERLLSLDWRKGHN